jgi:hypothetical protein
MTNSNLQINTVAGERENSFPRIGNMFALDPLRFRGSRRELIRGILSPRERAGVRGKGAVRTEATSEPGTHSAKIQAKVFLAITNVEEPTRECIRRFFGGRKSGIW